MTFHLYSTMVRWAAARTGRDAKGNTTDRRSEQAGCCPSIASESQGLQPASSPHRDGYLIAGDAIEASRNHDRRSRRGTGADGCASAPLIDSEDGRV